MEKEIIIALLTVGGSVLGNYIANNKQLALLKQRLDSLENKVDEHNNYAKMFHESHEDIALLKKDISYIKEKF